MRTLAIVLVAVAGSVTVPPGPGAAAPARDEAVARSVVPAEQTAPALRDLPLEGETAAVSPRGTAVPLAHRAGADPCSAALPQTARIAAVSRAYLAYAGTPLAGPAHLMFQGVDLPPPAPLQS